MGIIVSVSFGAYFREYALPAADNTDYSINIYRSFFKTKRDVALRFEVIDSVWRLCGSGDYEISDHKDAYTLRKDHENEVITVETSSDERISISFREVSSPVHPYGRYDICGRNRINIGSGGENEICSGCAGDDRGICASMVRQGEQWVLYAYGRDDIYLNGKLINGTAALYFGDCINAAGIHMVFLGGKLALDKADAQTSLPAAGKAMPGGKKTCSGGKYLFHRAPRTFRSSETVAVEIEGPPPLPDKVRQPFALTVGPAFTMAVPMLLGSLVMVYSSGNSGAGSGAFVYSGLIMSLSSALMGVFWAAAGLRFRKKDEAAREKRRTKAYENYISGKETQIQDIYRKECASLRELYPEAGAIVRYDHTSPLLWNRNMQHEDFLCCRLGTGKLPFEMDISVPQEKFMTVPDELAGLPREIRNKYVMLEDVPVLADIMRHPLTGVIGGSDKEGAYDAAALLLVQIAASHCYTDVKIAFLYDGMDSENMRRWDFVRYLPHVWSEDKKMRYVASDEESINEVCCELANILRQPREKPHFVLFAADPSLIENTMIERFAYSGNAETGLSAVVLSNSYERLPGQCGFIIRNDSVFRGMYGVGDRPGKKTGIVFDYLNENDLSAFARTLSGIEVPETKEGRELPAALTFLEMYGASRPEELDILRRWKKNRTYEGLRGMIGVKAGAVPCYLDMHEKYHGPHGLVAGTTGSGKSETLQTYILSLAVNYSPDDVGFFIIDYKGGGMAHLFDDLPHMLGQISNLSGSQIRRALVSIKSENRQRQRLFNEHGVNNINDYSRLAENEEAEKKVPHLFIIVDEFAELKNEEPDFMRDLISVAQVGRSLGVHLILATQKPGGTVDENIRSNSRFRLCLRVQSREDSMEVLHKPDAAAITQAGRGYLQVGSDEVYDFFQTGWSGAAYDETPSVHDRPPAQLMTITGKADKACYQKKARERERIIKSNGGCQAGKTQLEAVISCIRRSAEEGGYKPGKKLWLSALPRLLYLDELDKYSKPDTGVKDEGAETGKHPEISVGLFDDPQNQARVPLRLSPGECGHIAVTGSVLSGKSTFIQTFIYALIREYSPEQAAVYCIDYSGGALGVFEEAPHIGGVVTEGSEEKLASLFCLMGKLLDERKRLLKGGSFTRFIKRCSGSERIYLPMVFLVIDGFSAFNEKTDEKYMKHLISLSKEGDGNGIYLVVSAGKFGINELPMRIAENMRTVICMELPDKYAYSEVLRTSVTDLLPESGVKGRGLALLEGRALEFQTALAVRFEDDYRRTEEISLKCKDMKENWDGRAPAKIPEIPSKPEWTEFAEMPQVREAARNPRQLPVGYDRQSAGIYSIDLSQTFCYLITGRARSGKKNFMRVMISAAGMKNAEIAVIDEGDMFLPEMTGNIRLIRTADELYDFLNSFMAPLFKKRSLQRRKMELEGAGDDEIFDAAAANTPVFVFITDLAGFISKVTADGRGMDLFFENIFTRGRNLNVYFAGILSQERKTEVIGSRLFDDFISWREGIRFGGDFASETFLNFEYLSYAEQSAILSPGTGQLPEGQGENTVRQIVVPLVKRGRSREI